MVDRRARLEEFYGAVDRLRGRLGGARTLASASGRDGWPTHGIYLFFEPGELREDDRTPRVTRVGTHALTATSSTTLWTRLAQHRGTLAGANPGGGNHRGSIFRLHVGTALIARDQHADAPDWGRGSSAPREVRDAEVELERTVSDHIRAMPMLWLAVEDRQDRATIERDLIALLSNANRPAIDPPSAGWLGHHADRPAIRTSGLWNVHHIDRHHQGDGLDRFTALIEQT
ncbi:MAG: hypothetical protein R6U94_11405 [Nitriliruptoraceae bacterium]